MENLSINNYNIQVPYPKIMIFKGALKNSDELIEYYEEVGPWEKWHRFGTSIQDKGPAGFWNHFPSYTEWEDTMMNGIEDIHRLNIAKTFYEVTKIYVDTWNVENDSWVCRNWGLAKYKPTDLEKEDGYAMNYHTDYQPESSDSPGYQFGVTCVMYPNDDYEGGDLSFRVLTEDGTREIAFEMEFKPSKGDVIVFPSVSPYYHGVRGIETNHKYIIRTYWMHESQGSAKWHELKEKYGDAWEETELNRLRGHYKNQYFRSGIEGAKMTFSEYYEYLENGTLDQWNNN